MDAKANPYWDASSPPKDPKDLRSSPLLREGNSLCVDGAAKAFDRAGQRAFIFTDVTDMRLCGTKSVPH
jgi:hypothetical protein